VQKPPHPKRYIKRQEEDRWHKCQAEAADQTERGRELTAVAITHPWLHGFELPPPAVGTSDQAGRLILRRSWGG